MQIHQTPIHVFKQHAFLQTECLQLAASLTHDELCLLLAEIESLIVIEPDNNELSDLINIGIKLALRHPNMVENMKTYQDVFGNKIVQTTIEGDEEQFWMGYILGNDFRPIYQIDTQHIVYGHFNDCKVVEYESGTVRIRTGSKTSLLKYLFKNRPSNNVYFDDLFSMQSDTF